LQTAATDAVRRPLAAVDGRCWSGERTSPLRGAIAFDRFPAFARNVVKRATVDVHAVARHFSVSTRTVRRWHAAGMPSLLVGAQRRYRIGEVERWHREQAGSMARNTPERGQ